MDVKEINRRVIEQFRAGGEIEGMHRDRLLLLTTTGARTGRFRSPLPYGAWVKVRRQGRVPGALSVTNLALLTASTSPC